jgi:hypothetical protein
MPETTTLSVPAVDQVLAQTILAVQERINDMATKNRAYASVNPQFVQSRIDVIDLELSFKSVVLDGRSTVAKLLVGDSQKSSSLELKLTTRIRIES